MAARKRTYRDEREVSYHYGVNGSAAYAPAPEYVPREPERRRAPEPGPQPQPRKTPQRRPESPARVRVRVREQQPVAPFAIAGFLGAAALALLLLFSYIQLDAIYAETVTLQSELSVLESEGANLEALYEETFDIATLEEAVAADGTLSRPTDDQIVYIDLTEPDSAVVYEPGGIMGLLKSVGNLFSVVVEFFR